MENASRNCVTGISPENNAARSHGNYQADIANDGRLEGHANYRRVSSHETGVVDNSMQTQTLKLSLHVISGAGYGRSFDWNSFGEIAPGHQLSFSQSLRSLVDNIILLFIFPRWVFKLPMKRLQHTQIAFDEVGRYMEEIISEEKETDHSVLQALVKGGVLNKSELVGNAFVILLAGHEST
jgi:cytochrome P450